MDPRSPSDRVRNLRNNLPTQARKKVDNPANDRRVVLIEKTVNFPTAPAHEDHYFGIERRAVLAQLSHVSHSSALGARYVVLSETCGRGHI